jgi:hypothetical protein
MSVRMRRTEKQIPCGDDRKKGNSKDKIQGSFDFASRGDASLRMTAVWEGELRFCERYSWRRATTGSRREARKAGMKPLMMPTSARMTKDAIIVVAEAWRMMSPSWLAVL